MKCLLIKYKNKKNIEIDPKFNAFRGALLQSVGMGKNYLNALPKDTQKNMYVAMLNHVAAGSEFTIKMLDELFRLGDEMGYKNIDLNTVNKSEHHERRKISRLQKLQKLNTKA